MSHARYSEMEHELILCMRIHWSKEMTKGGWQDVLTESHRGDFKCDILFMLQYITANQDLREGNSGKGIRNCKRKRYKGAV